jgi:MarR family transcriptional regulator for hemolysin
MLEYDFEQSVGYWLTLAYQSYIRAVQQALAPHGITFRQAQVLGWLAADGPLSQRELAERMLIEPPNLVGVLNRMELAGLLQRRACPEDRRKKLIHPLPAAESLWQQIAECGRAVRAQAGKGMSKAERAKHRKHMNHLQANLTLPLPVV